MTRLTEFIENTMECPVNRDKTTIEKVGKLTLFGVTRDHGTWRIQREKARGACATYLGYMEDYKRTKDDCWLWTAARKMRGFISHFGIFPDFNQRQIRAIKRWCLNKWWETGERKTLFEQKWLITDQSRQSQPARAN